MDRMEILRIGTLGCARITPQALLHPAMKNDATQVVAIAARDSARAQKFAQRYGIPRVHTDYESLIQDPDIDAIYNPLPNSLHAEWSIRAMRAGKHVLCEKPMASNATEAERMHIVAEEEGRVLMEAFHWRYHPLAERLIELLRAQTIGDVSRIEASFCIPLPFPNDIRYNPELGGGALMDTGCYTVSILRHLMGEEPTVLSASAKKSGPTIDRFMEADLEFPSGVAGHIRCSIWGWPLVSVTAKVCGTLGSITVVNPVIPHVLYHHLKVNSPTINATERFWGQSTYDYQLRAFIEAIRKGTSVYTSAKDGILNMKVIDAIYLKSGMYPRGLD